MLPNLVARHTMSAHKKTGATIAPSVFEWEE